MYLVLHVEAQWIFLLCCQLLFAPVGDRASWAPALAAMFNASKARLAPLREGCTHSPERMRRSRAYANHQGVRWGE